MSVAKLSSIQREIICDFLVTLKMNCRCLLTSAYAAEDGVVMLSKLQDLVITYASNVG